MIESLYLTGLLLMVSGLIISEVRKVRIDIVLLRTILNRAPARPTEGKGDRFPEVPSYEGEDEWRFGKLQESEAEDGR